jgi:hypothetical protein
MEKQISALELCIDLHIDKNLADCARKELAERDQTIAELRSLMPCGHPKACLQGKNGPHDSEPICTVCREITELWDSLRACVDAIGHDVGCKLLLGPSCTCGHAAKQAKALGEAVKLLLKGNSAPITP